MAHIVIDGYNYINRSKGHDGTGSSLDTQRRQLIDRLHQFKRARGGRITVVFDAYNDYSQGRQRENHKGIDVVYSRQHETADEVIIGWIREKRSGLVVVTSDRAILDEAKAHGVPFLTPVKLGELMAQAIVTAPSLHEKDTDGDDEPGTARDGKKGNPRKLPKKLRKVTKAVKKL